MAKLPRPDPPVPFDPPPKPIREPDPDRLPDEGPLPNPDENDNPPQRLKRLVGAPSHCPFEFQVETAKAEEE